MLEIKDAVTVDVLILLKHMVFVGDWHLQNIFTQRNQYCAQIFEYVQGHLHAYCISRL